MSNDPSPPAPGNVDPRTETPAAPDGAEDDTPCRHNDRSRERAGDVRGPDDDLWERIMDLARPYLDTRHNLEHTEGSLEFARLLLASEGGDPEVVIPAVILHDVGWSAVSDEGQLQAFGPAPTRPDLNRLHEERGAEIAAEILASLAYDPVLTGEIAEIVGGHDSRTEALSLNDALVKDADRLFRLTRRGYFLFGEWFPLDYREYLKTMADRADRWFFTDTAKRLRDPMFADLEVYVGELERAADPDPTRRPRTCVEPEPGEATAEAPSTPPMPAARRHGGRS